MVRTEENKIFRTNKFKLCWISKAATSKENLEYKKMIGEALLKPMAFNLAEYILEEI